MRRGQGRWAWLGLAVVAVLVLGLLGQAWPGAGATGRAAQRPLRVVTTVGMITDVAQNIGGERVQVTGLMGPGVDPHLYRASEGDVKRLSEADIIFYNGLNLEAKMGDVLKRMAGRIKTVPVAEGIDRFFLLPVGGGAEGEYDPHVWFDVTLWMTAANVVRDTLAEADPESARYYQDNAARYLADMAATHQYVLAQAERVPPERRVLITSHDAFNYFGRAYGFEVRGLQGVSTATEAGAADVQALAEFIVQRRIPAIFVESSVPPRSIEAVREAVRARGFEVTIGGELFSDALGDPGTPEGTYLGMVRYNIDTIVGALVGG